MTEDNRARAVFDYYGANTQLLREIADAISDQNNDNKKVFIARCLFGAVAHSSDSLLILAQEGRVRDCAIIARCIFETLVNGLYLLASDESITDDLIAHAEMKQTRDLDREIRAGSAVVNIQHAAKDHLREVPSVKEALEKFTTAKGMENRQWTTDNLQRRLEIVENEFSTAENKVTDIFALAFVNYRFASEVLHGTLYAILEEEGISRLKPVISDEDRSKQLATHIEMILLTHGGCLGASVKILCRFVEQEDYSHRLIEIRKNLANCLESNSRNNGNEASQ